jgi:molecular chaperone HscB
MLPDFKSTHFELFDLPARFELDGVQLDAAYRHLQVQVHPDKFAHLPESEQRVSMQWSTRVNEAYQALKTPLNRAIYLLTLHGINALAPENTQLPMAFLMQQIEWREGIQSARSAGDLSALQAIERDLNRADKMTIAQLSKELDVDEQWSAAAQTVRQLKFIDKIREEIDDSYAALDM